MSQSRFRMNVRGSSVVRASSSSITLFEMQRLLCEDEVAWRHARAPAGADELPAVRVLLKVPWHGSFARAPNVRMPQRKMLRGFQDPEAAEAISRSFSRAASVLRSRIVMPGHPRAAQTAASGLEAIPT